MDDLESHSIWKDIIKEHTDHHYRIIMIPEILRKLKGSILEEDFREGLKKYYNNEY